MKKTFRVGNAIFFPVLLILLVLDWLLPIPPEAPPIMLLVAFLWTLIWRMTAWATIRHEIAEIFELTSRPRNSGSDVPDIIERLVRNADDSLLREIINKRIRYEMIGGHRHTARKIVGYLTEESWGRGNFKLQPELDLYRDIARELWTKEIERLIVQKGRPADVFFALIGRIAVASANDPTATELPETKEVERYLGTIDPEELKKLLIEAYGFATEEPGERGIKDQWLAVNRKFQEKYLKATIPT